MTLDTCGFEAPFWERLETHIAAKHVLRYIKGKVQAKMVITPEDGNKSLIGYFDASWAAITGHL